MWNYSCYSCLLPGYDVYVFWLLFFFAVLYMYIFSIRFNFRLVGIEMYWLIKKFQRVKAVHISFHWLHWCTSFIHKFVFEHFGANTYWCILTHRKKINALLAMISRLSIHSFIYLLYQIANYFFSRSKNPSVRLLKHLSRIKKDVL